SKCLTTSSGQVRTWYRSASTSPNVSSCKDFPSARSVSESADHDVIPVRIAQGELACAGAGIDARFLRERRDQHPGSRQCPLEIIDTEEQQQAVPRLGTFGTRQRRMLVIAPAMQADEDGVVLVPELPEVLMGRLSFRQAQQRLVPGETASHVRDADDGPQAFHAWLLSNPRGSHRSPKPQLLRCEAKSTPSGKPRRPPRGTSRTFPACPFPLPASRRSRAPGG